MTRPKRRLPIGPDKLLGEDARRASSKGFLNLSLSFYLDLLDWTGRNLAPQSLAADAEARGQKYMQASGAAAFVSG